MNKEDFYFLGKITKTSGYTGNLMFFFDVDDIQQYNNLEAVFISLNDELIPFAIRKISIRSNATAQVQLEDVLTEDAAMALVGNELYLPLTYLPPLKGNKFYFHEVIEFRVIDRNLGELGTVDRVMDQGSQAIFVVIHKNKEVLIPISNEIVKNVDRKNRSILVETPEGLIDIYL